MSAVGVHSVPPPRVTQAERAGVTPDAGGGAEAPPAGQRSRVLSAAGAVLGAGIVGVILFSLLGRAKPGNGEGARSEGSATPTASASARSAVVEPAGSAPAAGATASASASAGAGASAAASASASAAAPVSSARGPKLGPKPRDLAGKGEFKP